MSDVTFENISNFHVQYLNVTSQHWDPDSESFAGGDNLMTALANDWEIDQCVQKLHWFAGMRAITIYEFHLTRNGKKMTMPVVNNPYIVRFIRDYRINVINTDD